MRLLRKEDDGSFSLAEFLGQDTPPYAILSHTWGADSQEVTYHDVLQDTNIKSRATRRFTFARIEQKRMG
jgi:hypothetical protein